MDVERARNRIYVSGTRASAFRDWRASRGAPWWDTPYGRWRLDAEKEAMKRFPDFRLHEEDSRLCWVGRIRGTMRSASYPVKVDYPHDFPDVAQAVGIDHDFATGTPHLLDGNRPCLFNASQGPRNGYDPGRTTAATILAWTALWLTAYETWLALGVWPGEGT